MSYDKYVRVCRVVFYALIALALMLGVHYLFQQYGSTEEQPQKEQKEVVEVVNKDKTTTSFHYVPKQRGEDTDIQIERTNKPVVVNLNGKRHEIPTTQVKETSKFDNGKLVVTEERQVELKIDIPQQPQVKKGIYVETDNDKDITIGGRLSYQSKSYDVDLKAELWHKERHKDNKITLTATKWI